MSLIDIRHPCYTDEQSYWIKWRLVYQSGDRFISAYLKRLAGREEDKEFRIRRQLSYSPGFVKIAINRIKNKIYHRTKDISRVGGSVSYEDAVQGKNGGVDRTGSSMSYFVVNNVLTDLLVMRRVGVYVDMPKLEGPTLLQNHDKRPYCYVYPIENILSWSYDCDERLCSILLRDEIPSVDLETGLPDGTTCRYRHLYLVPEGVKVDIYTDDSIRVEETILSIPAIPFEMASLPYSIIADAANYQIALLNIESSDINYILMANFPFYTEQYEPTAHSSFLKGETDQDVNVGITKGRRYSKTLDRPGFIAPPSDPLKLSMEKAKQLKGDIFELIDISVENLQSTDAQVSGISYIGLILEKLENKIAQYWASYETTEPSSIIYPIDYSYPDPKNVIAEIDKDIELADSISSLTYKREITKRIARLSLSYATPISIINQIETEINSSPVPFAPYKTIAQDLVSGIVSLKVASEARGYPIDDVEAAAEDHAQRLLRIQAAQAPGGVNNAAARGILDLSADPNSGKQERIAANDVTNKAIPEDQTRGSVL